MVTEVPGILTLSAVEYNRLCIDGPQVAGTADDENERDETTKMADVKPLKEFALLIALNDTTINGILMCDLWLVSCDCTLYVERLDHYWYVLVIHWELRKLEDLGINPSFWHIPRQNRRKNRKFNYY